MATISRRVLRVDILSILFGIGSWICVNGLWVELPLLVQQAPEGWTLPSYLSFVITISNIAPISYSILNHIYPHIVSEKRGIYVTVVIGIVSTFLLAIFWNATSYLWGQRRSTALLSLVFFFGMVDCSSRVLYVPFMSNFQEMYLTSFFIGEGLSALVPSLFALVQGVGGAPECRPVPTDTYGGNVNTTELPRLKYEQYIKPPLFSVEIFFHVLLGIVLVSALAFHLLNYDVVVKHAAASSTTPENSKDDQIEQNGGKAESCNCDAIIQIPIELKPCHPELRKQENGSEIHEGVCQEPNKPRESELSNPTWLFKYTIILQTIVCFVSNGIFPSIQSFSSLPYGNVPYHLVVTLSTMINPIVCFIFFILPKPTIKSINYSTIWVAFVSIYVLITAVMSPNPPMNGSLIGEILLICSWVALMGFFTYIKVSLATILNTNFGKRGLFWFGASTQIGSATGSVATFLVVNFTTLFNSFDYCESLMN